MLDIECRIIQGNEGVSRIPKDGLDEIQVTNKCSGGKETNFHCFLRAIPRDFGADDRSQQQGDPESPLFVFRLIGCKW